MKHFYEDDSNSRCSPGIKIHKVINKDGFRSKVQRRLLLANIKELHNLFQLENPEHNIGLSKFYELRPG